eukprot:g1991.t1
MSGHRYFVFILWTMLILSAIDQAGSMMSNHVRRTLRHVGSHLRQQTRVPYTVPERSSGITRLAEHLKLDKHSLAKRIASNAFKATALGTTMYIVNKVEHAKIEAELGETEQEREENINDILEDYLSEFYDMNGDAEENDGLSLVHRVALDAMSDVDTLVEYPPMDSKRLHAMIANVDNLVRKSVERAREELHRYNSKALGGILGPLAEEMELDALNHAIDQIGHVKEIKEGWSLGDKLEKKIQSIRTHAQERKWFDFAIDMKDVIVLVLKFVGSDVEKALETGYQDLALVLRTVKTLWRVEKIESSLVKVRRLGRESNVRISSKAKSDDVQRNVRATFGALSDLFDAMDKAIGSVSVDKESSERVKMLMHRARDGLKGLKLVTKIAKERLKLDHERFILDVLENIDSKTSSPSMPIDVTETVNRIVAACADDDPLSFDANSRIMLESMHSLMGHIIENLSQHDERELREGLQIDVISLILTKVAMNDAKESTSSRS